MTILAIGIAWTLAGAALWLTARVHRSIQELSERPETAPAPRYDDGPIREAMNAILASQGDLESQVRDLHIAVDEGIQRVDRSERRVRAVVQRARKRLEDLGYEDEGLEAEARELRLVNGADSPAQPMQPVQQGVAAGEQGNRFAAFPGSWDGFGS